MTLSFSKPSLTKIVSPTTGTAEPCYTFVATTTEPLTGLFESEEPLSPVDYLTRHLLAQQAPWLAAFIAEFLKSTTKYFAKPYTPETVQSRLSHVVREKETLTPAPCSQVVYTPLQLAIFQGRFTLTWSVVQESNLIAIPEDTASQPSPSPADGLWVKTPRSFVAEKNVVMTHPPSTGLEDDVDAIPLTDSSDVVSLRPAAEREVLLDKRRVQEAALRAKLALLKAERTHAEYVQKYGQEASDESDSDETDSDETEEDSD